MRNKRKYDEFQISVLISFIFSIASSLLNYIFQMVIAKMLTVEEFGAYNSISAFSTNLAIVFTPLSIMTCQLTANWGNNLKHNRIIYRQILLIGLEGAFILGILGIFMYPYMEGKFGISSFFSLESILVMTGLSGIYNILYSFVQGRKKFVIYGIIGTSLIIIKIIISVMNIQLKQGILGVVEAMLFSYLIMCIFSGIYMKKSINAETQTETEIPKLSFQDIVKMYGFTFLTQIIASFYINGGDIILIEAFFSSKEVGLYSSATLIGKVGLYVISIISVVLLPTVAEKKSKGENTMKTLCSCLAISVILGIAYAIFLRIVGKNIIPMLFGEKYEEAFHILPYVMFYTIPLGLLNIVHSYFLGTGKVKIYSGILLAITMGALLIIKNIFNEVKYVPIILGIAIWLVIILNIIILILQQRRLENEC